MKAYADYKASGVEWLGEVPSHWQAVKFGQIFAENKIKNKGMIENNLLSLSYGNIIQKNIENAKGLVPENFETYQIVNPDDIIFRFTDLQNDKKSLRSAISKYRGIITSAYVSVKLKKDGNADFFNYLFRAYDLMKVFYSMGDGMRQSLKMDELNRLILVIPNEAEQQKIAQFLDTKTAQIDALITEQNRLIELLTEQRKAVISHAVTKGLNPNATMKKSGVEWLGEVPSGWEICQLRHLFSFNKGLTITKENLQENGIPCVNYGEIHSKFGFEVNPQIHQLKCVSENYLQDNLNSLLEYGDFIFADTSEDLEGSGNFTYLNSKIPTFAGYHTIIAKPKNKNLIRFYAYLFHSEPFRKQIRMSVKGIKVFSITQAILKSCFVWLPNEAEQNEIVNYLDEKTAQIDALITEQKELIERLKEYRTALISAAVTGKIDVQAV